MDMCYDGALVMPSSYARMKEEMCYVEGGTSTIKGISKISIRFFPVGISYEGKGVPLKHYFNTRCKRLFISETYLI